MKRFLLFTFDTYYPQGGWKDFFGSYDSLETARLRACGENWQIVDLETGQVVARQIDKVFDKVFDKE